MFKRRSTNNIEAENSAEEAELFSTKGNIGLRVLAEPVDVVVDIVFVHGLTGNRETTWTHKNGVFWPEHLLPHDLRDARIATWGYDADVVHARSTASSNTLRDHGKALAGDIAIWRFNTDTEYRPLIFVAHSLGGLVVEQCLLISRGVAEKLEKAVLQSTEAVIFMGTPHAGAEKADRVMTDAVTQLSALLLPTNKKIVRVLQPDSEVLANQQGEFHIMLADRTQNEKRPMKLFCFYEEQGYKKIGKIVPDHSAILTGYGSSSIPADHTGMTRFEAHNDPGYTRVLGRLKIWTKDIRTAQEKTVSQIRRTVGESSSSERNDEGISMSPKLIGFYGDTTTSGGGVYQGTFTSGKDIVFNHGQK